MTDAAERLDQARERVRGMEAEAVRRATAEAEAPPERLRIYHASELAQRPRPPTIIKDLFTAGGLSVVYGASGSLKSFLAVSMAGSIASGLSWFGRPVRAGAVLYVAAEGGGTFSDRLEAWTQRHAVELTDIPLYVLPDTPDLRSPDGDASVVLDRIAKIPTDPPLALVIVDTLSRALSGGDENSSVDLGGLVQNLDRIRAATGAHVTAVHHAGKDVARGARGHSLLKAAVDTEVLIERDEATGVATARFAKQRDLPDGTEITFKGEQVQVRMDDEGEIVTSLVVEPAEAPASKTAKLTPRLRSALDALRECLVDHGHPAPEEKHYPPGARVVSLDQWRETLFMRAVLDRDARNPREDFRRVKIGLQDRGEVGIWNDQVWLAKPLSADA